MPYKILYVIVLLLFVSGCVRKTEPVFRVGTNVWPGYELLYLAEKLGYYDGSSIKLVELPSASEVIRAFRNRGLEGAALTMDEALLLNEQGHDIRVILVTNISNGGDTIIARGGIKEFSQLKGRKVGVEASALGGFFLARALQMNQMSVEDIEIVPLEMYEHQAAFNDGLVDAVVTFEPVRTILLNAGGIPVFDSTQIPNEIIDIIVVRAEDVSKPPKALDVLISGWFRALDYFRENPQQAARLMAERYTIEPEAFLKSLDGLIIPDIAHNIELLSGEDPAFNKTLSELPDFMAASNLLKSSINPNDIIDNTFVKKALK